MAQEESFSSPVTNKSGTAILYIHTGIAFIIHFMAETVRLIARVVKKVRLGEEPRAVEYWRTQSYSARIDALEQIRQEYHRWKHNAEPGFQRVYRVVKR